VNKGTFRSAVQQNIGTLSADPYFTDAIIDGFVHKALRKLDSAYEWPWSHVFDTLPTVSNQEFIVLPSGWSKTIALTINDYQSLTPTSLIDLRSETATGRGMPISYAIAADKLYLRPTPDAVYSITHDYMLSEPDLANDAATPRLPAAYHDAVVDLASFYALNKAGEQSRADRYLEQYRSWVSDMRRDVRRMTEAPAVRVRPGGWI